MNKIRFLIGTGILCGIVVLGLASCTAKKGTTVGVSLLTREHIFYNKIEESLQKKADAANIELIIEDGNFDSVKQENQVQNFIAQGVDAIIISPASKAGTASAARQAKEAGIPVFTMDTTSDGDIVAHVATDNYKGGQLAAEYVAETLLTEHSGNVAVITYSEIESTLAREKGFTDVIAEKYNAINVVDIQNCSGSTEKAANVTQDILLKNPDLDIIFAVGDPFAIGALSAIRQAGREVRVVGFDGNPESITAIQEGGLWVADIAQDPGRIAEQTLEHVIQYLGGNTPPRLTEIQPYVIDSSTL